MMHYLFYVLVEEQQDQGIKLSSWSWVYQSTCCLLWQARPIVPTFYDQAVLPLTTVDNSCFSPHRLTVHSNSPYDQQTIPATHFKQRGF
jgi:hypothetical protein